MARWFWGILILAIVALLLSLFGPWNAPDRSEYMGGLIQSSLNEAGFDYAKVEMNGNYATLKGVAPTEDSMEAALEVARNPQCAECPGTDRIWHYAVGEFTVEPQPEIPVVSPYTFQATKSADGRYSLSGVLRNNIELGRINTEANALYGANGIASNTLSVANGAPNEMWGQAASKYLTELALLDQGRVLIRDDQVLVTGRTNDESLRARINERAITPVNGYKEAVNITIPNTAAAFTGTVDSQEVCQSLMNELKGETKINFATNSATIGADSYELLDALVSAARQCPGFRIRIEGHTDSAGSDAYNLDLSERRSRSVSAYLSQQNIGAERITAVGYGETRPMADNGTDAGRAKNRRIEFIVTQSE